MAIGLLVLRVTLGLVLAAHGAQKLFGWFGGLGLHGTGRGLAALGFHPGRRHAFVAGLVELTGGFLLALGLATPLAATTFVSVMFVAAVGVHMRNGFFITDNGYEYNLVLAVSALSLAFTGPGSLSLDAAFGLPMGGWSGAWRRWWSAFWGAHSSSRSANPPRRWQRRSTRHPSGIAQT
jgi:putative oxidoreductase